MSEQQQEQKTSCIYLRQMETIVYLEFRKLTFFRLTFIDFLKGFLWNILVSVVIESTDGMSGWKGP